MKAILICPAERSTVESLYEMMPLVLVPMLGKNLVEYWMEHLVAEKFTDVIILAADRPEQVRAYVEGGERWGIKAEVRPATHELNQDEAKALVTDAGDLQCVEVMEYLPLLRDHKLFTDYKAWYSALLKLMPQTSNDVRIGLHEIQPGIWTSLHDAISPKAKLIAPCWIGKDVTIEEDAVVGPYAIIEDGVCIETGAEVANSVVLNETLVGEWTEIKNSIAWANTLIHLPDGVSAKVPDEFLLAALDEHPEKFHNISLMGQAAAAVLLVAIAPFACLAMARSFLKGSVYLRVKTAVKPYLNHSLQTGGTVEYFEVPSRYGWIRRWPQLWEAVCGRFALIGNRPLTAEQAAELKCDFEKMWLSVPMGVISLADVQGGIDIFGERARAHACYYAVKWDWRLDASIFYGVVIGRPLGAFRAAVKDLVPTPVRYPELGGQG